ncbi:hypothetical protein [Roseimicrobium sp. ORNL1]|uniref:hypothetical protein n=1 Tax=Roseimicrobium sp. ORNL1 TaxID=2711231 RepID=UPI0013E19B50|nr:hypothetical protein [Roseimicrobium sp. ORNL1]QIF00806.1 hypothetical protein G5S37_04455 [Roseimicrobium sp. ORNL1]
MATLLFFPAQDCSEVPRHRSRSRHSSHLAAAFAALSSAHEDNVDLRLLEHLVMEEDEGDEPRAA